MDWINDFIKAFSNYFEIKFLKADKFHGKLEINFSDGVAQSYNLVIHRRKQNEV